MRLELSLEGGVRFRPGTGGWGEDRPLVKGGRGLGGAGSRSGEPPGGGGGLGGDGG